MRFKFFSFHALVVFPTKYIYNSGNFELIQAISKVEELINRERSKQDKPPIGANKYYVCNQDEPYADKVIQIILNGEDQKLKQKGIKKI